MSMAKRIKNSNLSIEERLEQALIPNWDEPYNLPENWCWTTIKQVAEIVTGGTPSKKNPEYYGESFPFFKPADLDAGRSVRIASEYLSEKGKAVARIIPAKSTAVCCIGSIGKSGYLEVDGTTNQQINSAIPKINPLYLYYYVNTDFFTNQLWQKSSATTISIVNKSKMEECTFPLCPADEQQRIVDRIETLFTKLDKAKEKAEEVVDGFESRKAAIFHKAFSGELTAKWREQNEVSIDSWTNVTISDVCKVNPPKINTKDLADDLEVSFFPMPALSEVYGEITEPQTRKLKEVKTGFTNFSEGDVVFAKITPCMENGKSAVIGKLVNNIGYGTTEFYVLRCNGNLYNRYLYHLVRSKTFRDEAKCVMTGAVGQQRVPKSFIEEYNLNLPSFCEQEKIVSILDSFFEREQKTKETAETTIEQIDIMKKAILAHAFRGELGTNDPSEESAVELLKKVLVGDIATQVSTKKPTKRISIPSDIKELLSNIREEEIIKLLLKSAPQPVSINEIMSLSSKKFELMDALRTLEKKQLITKNESGEYSLMR